MVTSPPLEPKETVGRSSLRRYPENYLGFTGTTKKTVTGVSTPWVLTYDDCPEIRKLDRRMRIFDSEVTYSAHEASRGREIVVLGPRVRKPVAAAAAKRGYCASFELL